MASAIGGIESKGTSAPFPAAAAPSTSRLSVEHFKHLAVRLDPDETNDGVRNRRHRKQRNVHALPDHGRPIHAA
ncbi:hypothetical protein [Burkholderia dolosa]|uniref:hypothetical protein n=1 Tax=Burkholderia dolosa TaxID=152500 RepID=UPI001B956911|nr:hypothetical protein [Burkholderia dolosa]MBR8058216.1 hypothetical protein [Burkholderia dolosa]MBY4829464.1 hypothetical protein [Burkholderia dolosa]